MLMKRSKLKGLIQLSTEVKLGLKKLQSTVVSMTVVCKIKAIFILCIYYESVKTFEP